jgi:hypothetical protein
MLLVHCYLRHQIVYVPTVVKLKTGAYWDIEPVAVCPIANTDGMRRAVAGALARGNAVISPPPKDRWPPPVILKYAGVKTWSAFARGTSPWTIRERSGLYEITASRDHPDGYWVDDRERTFELPPGSSAEDTVKRMIEILQDDARKK